MKDPHDIIVRPIVTEKSMQMLEENKYLRCKAGCKQDRDQAGAGGYIWVKVKAVNTANFKGKKRLGHYPHGYKPLEKGFCHPDRR